MEPGTHLTVIIPSYNEAENLRIVLPPLLDHCRENNWRIILVDDGSTDKTLDLLKHYDRDPLLTIIRHKLNKGYGAAIKSGIRACQTEYLITYDADGQHFIEDIDKLRCALLENDADMVVGSRKGLKSSTHFRNLGKAIIRLIARIMMTVPVHDLNSGMKIYRTDIAQKYLFLTPDTMSFSDVMTLVFINNRHLVLEEPIRIRERSTGQSTIGIQTAFQTVMEILHIVILFNPMKIFLPLSILCFLLTCLWGIPLLIQGRGLSIGTLLGLIMVLLLFLLGLIAEQLSLIRRNQHP
jgi:glycosyltransferase involved in cell wall biosynthesis